MNVDDELTATRDDDSAAEPQSPLLLLLQRWWQLPALDPTLLREDIDGVLDPSL